MGLRISIEMAAFSIENSTEKRPFRWKFAVPGRVLRGFPSNIKFDDLLSFPSNTKCCVLNGETEGGVIYLTRTRSPCSRGRCPNSIICNAKFIICSTKLGILTAMSAGAYRTRRNGRRMPLRWTSRYQAVTRPRLRRGG